MDSLVGRVQKMTPPRNYADKIADVLRGEIERGIFKPGERLPTENLLSTTFGVSRAVIREAISALKHDGVLESFQGRGIFMRSQPSEATFRLVETDINDDEGLQKILEFLIAIEVAATGIAAERRTKSELAQIKRALGAMERAIEKGEPGIEEDMNFHSAIATATNNPFFISFSAFLENRVRHLIRTARATSSRAGLTALVQSEHRAIYDAIAAGDRDAASKAAEQHLRNAAARLKKYRKSAPAGARAGRS